MNRGSIYSNRILKGAFSTDPPESGAVILEMALIAPLLVLILSGAISLGFALNESHVAAEATRHGARIASALSGSISMCRNPDGQSKCSDNTSAPGTDYLDDAAKFAACRYIRDYGFDPDQWTVSAEISDPVFFGDFSMRTVEVTLNKSDSSSTIGLAPYSRSVFGLQQDCIG